MLFGDVTSDWSFSLQRWKDGGHRFYLFHEEIGAWPDDEVGDEARVLVMKMKLLGMVRED